jgi:hypothetical protein
LLCTLEVGHALARHAYVNWQVVHAQTVAPERREREQELGRRGSQRANGRGLEGAQDNERTSPVPGHEEDGCALNVL